MTGVDNADFLKNFNFKKRQLLNIIISVMGTIVISLCNSILLLRVD